MQEEGFPRVIEIAKDAFLLYNLCEGAGYRENFWLFQQYAGYGNAEEANKRYRF